MYAERFKYRCLTSFLLLLLSLSAARAWGIVDEPRRIVSISASSKKEEILFLDAKNKIERVSVFLPSGSQSIRSYFISSNSQTPLKDFHAAVADASIYGKHAQIVFDGGTYEFECDHPLAFLNIERCKDLRIVGNGSHLIFDSAKTGFRVWSCNRLLISDLRMTYRHRVASFGKVISGDGGKKQILLDAQHWGQSEDSDTYKSVTSVYRRLGSNPFHRQASYRWLSHGTEAFDFDVETKIYTPRHSEVLRSFKVGEPVTLKHAEYGSNAFRVGESSNVCIQKCVVSNIPGMFLFARKVPRGILVRGNKVMTNPDDPLSVVAASADGVHLSSVDNNIIIRNNQFSRLGDDAINLHSNYWRVVSVAQPDTLVVEYPYQASETFPITAGSGIQIFSPSLMSRVSAKVKSVIGQSPPNTYQLIVDKSVDGVKPSDIVNVIRWQPKKFVVANNHFHDFWGRGMLIQARNGIIEKNVIQNLSGSGIVLTTDNFDFFESGGCRNVVVSHNQIFNSSKSLMSQQLQQTNMGAISITARIPLGLPDYPQGYPLDFLHVDLLLSSNLIRNCGGPGVFLCSARNATLIDNVIKNHSTIPFDRNSPGKLNGATRTGFAQPIYDFYSTNTTIVDE